MDLRDDEIAYMNEHSTRCVTCGHLEAFHGHTRFGYCCLCVCPVPVFTMDAALFALSMSTVAEKFPQLAVWVHEQEVR